MASSNHSLINREMPMDWLPAISTTALFSFTLWLFRNLIKTRLVNAVKHEYDAKIENLKTELRKSEEVFKAELRVKESQMEALRSGALSSIATRQQLVFERQLKAIEGIWESVILLGRPRLASYILAVINIESAAKESKENDLVRGFFSKFSINDLNGLNSDAAIRCRPFAYPLSWAYFSAYQAIVMQGVLVLKMLSEGIYNEKFIKTEVTKKLVLAALPHQEEFINERGVHAVYYLLDELQDRLLLSFQLVLNSEVYDKETLERSAEIIKLSAELMKSNEL